MVLVCYVNGKTKYLAQPLPLEQAAVPLRYDDYDEEVSPDAER